MKFHPTANNHVVDIIESNGGEAVMPDLIDFFQYGFYNSIYKHEHYEGKKSTEMLCRTAIKFVDWLRKDMIHALKNSQRFDAPHPINKLQKSK